MQNCVLSVIPARGGSKEIPRKNLRELGDRPLVAHAITTSRDSELVDEVVLTTDSQEIAQISRQYSVDRIIGRPERLATDEVPLAPVVEHAYKVVDDEYKYILCVQPTAPLVTPSSIDAGIETGIADDAGSVIYVKDSTHHYWKVGEGNYQSVSTDRKNRQFMNPIYGEIGLFLTHQDILADGKRVGPNPSFYEVPPDEGIDIDTYQDWILAESQLGRKQLIYRVTGSAETGTGHVYRGITIADRLFEHDIQFATSKDDEIAIEKLEESNYDYWTFEDPEEFVKYVSDNRPEVLVNDILDTSTEYMQSLRELDSGIVNFEDLGDGANLADAVINALYEHSDPPKNHYFGFKYFCLRNEFQYATPHMEIPSVDRIMISFGGTDENNLTAKTLRALSTLERECHLDVVLGLGYSERETLEPIVSGLDPGLSVEINQNVRSMAEQMELADLLITSNGRTLYEAASLNLPTISIAQNQRESKHPYAHISRGIFSLGQADYVTESNIRTAVEDYVADQSKRNAMCESLKEHDIASGVSRIKSILFEEVNEN